MSNIFIYMYIKLDLPSARSKWRWHTKWLAVRHHLLKVDKIIILTQLFANLATWLEKFRQMPSPASILCLLSTFLTPGFSFRVPYHTISEYWSCYLVDAQIEGIWRPNCCPHILIVLINHHVHCLHKKALLSKDQHKATVNLQQSLWCWIRSYYHSKCQVLWEEESEVLRGPPWSYVYRYTFISTNMWGKGICSLATWRLRTL